jgi:radical SAM protein with 4Fe4S-binding SPASM domain
MELPTFVQIEPVGQCNLKCRMCPVMLRSDAPSTGAPAFMDFDQFVRVLDEFPALKELHLQGLGEPMMHPRFFEMVAYAAGKGITVTTNTNLTLMSEARAERCVTSGLHTMHVSFDGATPATYEGIRLGSSFDRVVANVEKVVRARSRLASDRPCLQLVVVIMRRNLEELPSIIRLAHQWSMTSVFVQHLGHDFDESTLPIQYRPMRDFIREETLLYEDPEKIERHFAEARAVAQELSVVLRLPRMTPREPMPGTQGRRRCDWPWRGAYLTYEGHAIPCCVVATPDRVHLGNMVERGVAAVWNDEHYQRFREQLDSDDPPEVCRSCAVYKGIF